MKKTNDYTINFAEGKITMTRGFVKRAGIIDSNEYRLFTMFRRDYPDFEIEVRSAKKNAKKNTHKGLNLDFMAKVIDLQENDDTAKAEFERVKSFYKGHPAYYAKVKAWFLAKYPDYDLYAPAPTEEIPTSNPAPAQDEEVTTIAIAG